jgi:hypothetical protein
MLHLMLLEQPPTRRHAWPRSMPTWILPNFQVQTQSVEETYGYHGYAQGACIF